MIMMTKRGVHPVPLAHPNPLEVVEAAVGVVDVAWTALEKHRSHRTITEHQQDDHYCSKLLERQLENERLENQRLRAILEDFAKALQEQTNNLHHFPYSSSAVQDAECPSDFHQQIQEKVASRNFLEKLKELQKIEEDGGNGIDPEDGNSWVWVPDDLYPKDGKEEPDGLGKDGYVIVSQDDVIDGVAAFVASVIVSNPKAKKLSPQQLQEVVSSSFDSMNRRGRLRNLWHTAKFLYTSATWTTAAFGLYKNPIIVKALFRALFMSSRLVVKALV